ncbi:ABC transporter permease [Amycolatopsis sp.]|jgi:ABC-2 type transport system permease protein|uniref:ABC transporter permease n=1 Tax=Amycolatopsis sp. TaxID=37632 RepID=UPI002E0608E4|nr:ABC transporter permease [Amycolatopsis sp.]
MLRDTWLIFRRDMALSLRNPAWIMIGLMQPLLYLFLFGPMFAKVAESTPGFPPGDGWMLLTPALIVQLALFGSSFAGFGLLADYRAGVVERLRVTPVSRVALLLGKVFANALQTVAQSILIIVMAYFLFDIDPPFGGIVLTMIIVALLSVTLASCSYALALTIKSEEAFPAILNAVLLPLLLLSGILLPITTGLAPQWLYNIARFNPFRYVVDASRSGFLGDFTMDALFTGCVVLAAMTALAVWWGARTFQRENA